MTTSRIDQHRTVEALAAEWASLRELIADLPDDAWRSPTALPGWDVQANVAHVIGTEKMLLGDPNPDVPDDRVAAAHVRNDIGAFNEVWVQALAGTSPREVLALFDDVTSRRLEVLRAMPAEEWHAETFTPAGRDSYGRFMQIRVFDCWFHEQDIREALGRPGHDAGIAVEVALDELTTAMGFVVGKRAGAPDGSRVTLELTGPAGRSIHVAVDGRARVVDALDGAPTTVVRVPVVPFTRLCGGRVAVDDVQAQIEVEGNRSLGEAIVANLAYTV